jgi:hypothetical protein
MEHNKGGTCHKVGNETVNGRSAGELRNIQEGTQSATRFEIPAGYSKMDIGNMMQQHSQQH